MDLTSLLQGGSLAAIAAIIGPVIIQEIQRRATKKALRSLRGSSAYKDLLGFAPYVAAGVYLYTQHPALPMVITAVILAGAVTTNQGHRRWRPFHLGVLAVLAVGSYVLLRTFWAPAVVVGTAIFRDCWTYLLRRIV